MADTTRDVVTACSGALLAPPSDALRQGLFDRCAVFDAQRREIAQARTEARIGVLTIAPDSIPDPQDHLDGSWLFGGVAYGHFGHALAFSTARLWALDRQANVPRGILFLARGADRQRTPVSGHLANLLNLFGVDLPAVTIARPTTVETLFVPSQGWGTGDLITGTPAFRAFTRKRLATGPRPAGVKRLYISRAKLPERHARGLMFQGRLNGYLKAEGYRIFHPQEHPLPEQVAAYRAADRIIAEDGSALHLAAMAAHASTRFAILATRAHFPIALARQIRAFAGARAQVFSFIRAVLAPQSARTTDMAWNRARIALDFEALAIALAQTGFVNHPDLWKNPPDPKLERRIASLEKRMKEPMVKLPLSELDRSGPIP